MKGSGENWGLAAIQGPSIEDDKSKSLGSDRNPSKMNKNGPLQTIRTKPPVYQRALQSSVAGMISGCTSCLLLQPLELVKTRIQQSGGKHKFWGVTLGVVKKEGFFALWSGLKPSLFRVAPGAGLYFGSLYSLQAAFVPENAKATNLQNFAFGAGSRCVGTVLVMPLTIIKTRFESSFYNYTGVFSAGKTILQKEGIKALLAGTYASLMRDGPQSGVYLMCFRFFQSQFTEDQHSSKWAPVANASCAIGAGWVACAITQPFDMVKTSQQLFPAKYPTIYTAFQLIHKEYGLQGFWRGFIPRAVRRTSLLGLSWTVYEEMLKRLHISTTVST